MENLTNLLDGKFFFFFFYFLETIWEAQKDTMGENQSYPQASRITFIYLL